MNFRVWNLRLGWFAFAISLLSYLLTVEPTASYWDCSEYIATAAKLQVGHPPGAPFFQMVGAVFAILAPHAEYIALSVNMMSVLASSFTVLFLFWTITGIARRLVRKQVDDNHTQILVLIAGLVGALGFAYTDSFWFNAVEAEVYAMATCILSILFWLGLRWEADMDKPRGDRWLVLIAFVVGLSFGVHFMGLLTIPAIGMLYYFKTTETVTIKGFVLANILSIAVLLFIFKLLLPSTLAYFGYAEVFFVNQIGLPFHSGTIAAGLSLIAFFVYTLQVTHRKNWVQLNTTLLCVLFILVGFSSWLMLPIRANANTVINENAPTDARALLAYYNLEQYPDTHLFYGPMFTDMYAGQDENTPYVDAKPKYEKDEKSGRYIIVNEWENAQINSNRKHEGILPRMWSSGNATNYMTYYGTVDFDVKLEYRNEEGLVEAVNTFISDWNEGRADVEEYHNFLTTYAPYLDIEKPSFFDNLRYMFDFQMGYMYWRYFMWNFSGRQNDLQGKLDPINGNWISGIPFIDNWRLGPQELLPSELANNKGKNKYYMLPLLMGILGFAFLYGKDPKRFWVMLLLFLFTGLALKVYLNERVFEPRERDYALVGSFYTFSIFIGLGVLALSERIRSFLRPRIAVPIVGALSLLCVPVLLASENWDDHDRSGRYTAQSTAKAYLDSVEEDVDAMIFTIGDNDTFAIWYAQEIEGYRTDVRSINTQLLATDWYIDQLKRRTYTSSPIPSQLEHRQYAYGVRDYIKHEALLDSVRWTLNDFMRWVSSDQPRTQYKFLLEQYDVSTTNIPKSTQQMIYYPTNQIRVPVNKENVLKSGVVKPEDAELIVDYIDIDLPTSGLYKNRLMMLDILHNNDWERPIYFTGGSYDDSEYFWMKDYLQLDGLVYKLVPIKTPIDPNNPYQMGRIDANQMYDIVMKWDWGNSDSPDIYHDPETRKNSISFRSNITRLANALIEDKQVEKAITVLDLTMDKMPIETFGYYSLVTPIASAYYRAGATEKAQQIVQKLAAGYHEYMRYYAQWDNDDQLALMEDLVGNVERYKSLLTEVVQARDYETLAAIYNRFYESILPFSYIYGKYDFYTELTPFVAGLYAADQLELARELSGHIAQQYIDLLNRFLTLEKEQLTYFEMEIGIEVEAYKSLVSTIKRNETDSEVVEKVQSTYTETVGQFSFLD
ncbi:MAG: protein O-mannosyl-transferase family [Flavobacteriaceae bacterium]